MGVESPDPRVNRVVRDLHPGGGERLELLHKDVGCCGVRQGDGGEEPVRVEVLEVFPEGCHQPSRGSVFLCCGGLECGGGMVSQSWSGVASAREGCPGVMLGCPTGTFPMEGFCCWGMEQGPRGGH